MERESFVFYRSFFEAIRLMPVEVQTELYPVICEYALFGKISETLSPMAKAIFILMKPNIDTNTTRYENGKKGGRKKKQPQEDVPTAESTQTASVAPPPPSPAATTYDVSYDQEIDQMKADNNLRETICQDYSITATEYDARLSRFLRACKESTEKDKHESYEDCKRHFRYWMDKACPAPQQSTTLSPPAYNLTYDQEIDQMKADRAWNESQCRQFRMTEAELHSLIEQFKFHCMKHKRRHESLRDAEFHFQSWLQQLRSTPNETNIQSKTQRRGRVQDVEPQKHYSDSF